MPYRGLSTEYDWRDRNVDAYRRQVAEKLARILEIVAETWVPGNGLPLISREGHWQ